MGRYDIVGKKKCECGCDKIIYLKGWHYEKSGVIPRFIVGHNPSVYFKKDNKANWKGGRIKCNGYWMVYKPKHPNANKMGKGYVREHRLIMEKKLGRYLAKDEIVHHINGDKADNRLKNLVVTTLSEHSKTHHKTICKNQKRDSRGRFFKGGDAHEAFA